jgi:hypothetical protein
MVASDGALLEAFLTPVRKCALYKPAFGQSGDQGVTLPQFQTLYGQDPFYAFLGLNDPAVYAAHKAAGGLTSVYRQIGVGSERLIRLVMGSTLGLSEPEMLWSYQYVSGPQKTSTHTLDVQVRSSHLRNSAQQQRLNDWLGQALKFVFTGGGHTAVDGLVMEVRQGYKSADAKRQSADLRFGLHAYAAGLLPVVLVMSGQVSEPVIRRYRADGMLVLTGVVGSDPFRSTFAFFEQVVGYDLRAFFERNSEQLRREITLVVRKLLTPDV